MKSFSVLTDRWIDIRENDGRLITASLLDTILNSQNYMELVDESPLFEFGVFRLLQVFILDAIRPYSLDDILDILEEGRFDEKRIQDYLDKCNEEGVSFDLFDEKRPFLQSDNWKDSDNYQSIAKLDPFKASGNNHVHIDHNFEENSEMTVPLAARALCASYIFSTSGAQGYPSGPCGAPPIYSVVKGSNLFETLVYNLVPFVNYENADRPGSFWRNNIEIESKKEVASTSLLYGMMFPCRKIKLASNSETDMVSKMLYAQGMNYQGYDSYTDPNVSYMVSKNGRVNLKPDLNKEYWRNINTLIGKYNGTAPAVISQYAELSDSNIHVTTYEVVTSNAAYIHCNKNEFEVGSSILKDNIKNTFVSDMTQTVETKASVLRKAIGSINLEHSGEFKSLQSKTVTDYYLKCKRYFHQYLSELNDCNLEDLESLKERWTSVITKESLASFDDFGDKIANNARDIVEVQIAKGKLLRKEK